MHTSSVFAFFMSRCVNSASKSLARRLPRSVLVLLFLLVLTRQLYVYRVALRCACLGRQQRRKSETERGAQQGGRPAGNIHRGDQKEKVPTTRALLARLSRAVVVLWFCVYGVLGKRRENPRHLPNKKKRRFATTGTWMKFGKKIRTELSPGQLRGSVNYKALKQIAKKLRRSLVAGGGGGQGLTHQQQQQHQRGIEEFFTRLEIEKEKVQHQSLSLCPLPSKTR